MLQIALENGGSMFLNGTIKNILVRDLLEKYPNWPPKILDKVVNNMMTSKNTD